MPWRETIHQPFSVAVVPEVQSVAKEPAACAVSVVQTPASDTVADEPQPTEENEDHESDPDHGPAEE